MQNTYTKWGGGVKYFSHAGDAIKEFLSVKYSLIITDLDIAPGLDCQDQEIMEIMNRAPLGRNPDYWRVALKVVERIRQNNSPNKHTPVIVASVYHPEEDGLFKNAARTCLKAGANHYCYLVEEDNDGLVDKIRKELRK